MRRAALYCLSLMVSVSMLGLSPSFAQDSPSGPSLYTSSSSARRVFVTDSNSWSMSGGFGGSSGGFAGGVSGGARPQTAEVIKTFRNKCPGVVVTINRNEADFVVLFDHEGGKGWARKDNKIAIFYRNGDAIFSDSTRSLGNAVEGACKAILAAPLAAAAPPPSAPPAANPMAHPVQPTMAQPPAAPAAAAPAQPAAAAEPSPSVEEEEPSVVFVKSTPLGADIEVDGNFMGNTPSNLKLDPGEHKIAVSKDGYSSWERTMKVTAGGNITLNPTLDKDK
jgi:PEGA domain